jgi:hypothetical protein
VDDVFGRGNVDIDNVKDPFMCVTKFLGTPGACGGQPLIQLN